MSRLAGGLVPLLYRSIKFEKHNLKQHQIEPPSPNSSEILLKHI